MTFWDLVQAYVDEWGATEAAIQRRAGVNKGTFTAWRQRGIPALPTHAQLIGLADTLHVKYETLLMTILRDLDYLPESAARARLSWGEESQGISDAEQRWGPVVHRRVSELLQRFKSDVGAAYEHHRSEADLTDPIEKATSDYLRAIFEGDVSFVTMVDVAESDSTTSPDGLDLAADEQPTSIEDEQEQTEEST